MITVAANLEVPGVAELLAELQTLVAGAPDLVVMKMTDAPGQRTPGQRVCYQDALSFIKEECPDLSKPGEAAVTLWDLLTVRGFGGKKYPLECSNCQKRPSGEEQQLNCQCPKSTFNSRRYAQWTVSPDDLAKITQDDIEGLNIRHALTRERLWVFLQWLR
jgi:hypothetical protein